MRSELRATVFAIPGATWTLRFGYQALDAISKCAQRRWYSKERVGQLFACDLTTNDVVIEAATVLKPAWSSWSGVQFHRHEAETQREEMLARGLHCVGLWHTHPESECSPSATDARLAADHAVAAKANLNGLVFVIASNQAALRGWYVAVHDGERFHKARSLTRFTPVRRTGSV